MSDKEKIIKFCSDINNILEILYSLKKDILFTQKLLTTDSLECEDRNIGFYKRIADKLKQDEEMIEVAYKFIKEKFPDFKCPDEDYRININKLGNIL